MTPDYPWREPSGIDLTFAEIEERVAYLKSPQFCRRVKGNIFRKLLAESPYSDLLKSSPSPDLTAVQPLAVKPDP